MENEEENYKKMLKELVELKERFRDDDALYKKVEETLQYYYFPLPESRRKPKIIPTSLIQLN